MTNRLTLLAVLLLICAGSARADGIDPIETRQAGQDLFAATYAGIRVVVATKGDVKTLENPAKAMARWMKQFPTQFPKGSEEGHNTRALPAVWSDNEGFLKTANEMVDATTKLAELAKAGDADAVAAQVKAVGEVCAACHRTYRAR
jgi:cytochrome c556